MNIFVNLGTSLDDEDDTPLAELQQMMRALVQDPAVDAGVYVDIDSQEEIAPSLDDDTIVSLVAPNAQDDSSESEQSDDSTDGPPLAPPPPPPTAKGTRAALRSAIEFFEMLGDTDSIDKLNLIMNQVKPAKLRQASLKDFFKD